MTKVLPKRITEITNPAILAELETFPNQPVIWGMLEGHNKGQLWELSGGQSIVLFEDNPQVSFVFIAGHLDLKTIETAIHLCITYPIDYPMIYCRPYAHEWFLTQGWTFNPRIQLSYITPALQPVREGWAIKPINTMKLFQECLSFKEMSHSYGSPEQFLKLGKGYALCQGSQIISEAYIAFHGRNCAEIIAITHPDYRRQNAAAQVTSYLVEECKTKGLIPMWSCNADNIGSLKTALKIGFVIERYDMQMIPEIKKSGFLSVA